MSRGRMDYSVKLEDALEMYDNAAIGALEWLEEKGLADVLHRPKKDGRYFDGRLPPDINSMGATQLGEWMGMMTIWTDYVQQLVTTSKADTINAEQKIKVVKAKIRRTATGTVADQDDIVQCDSRYVEVVADWLEVKTRLGLAEGVLEAAKRDVKTISRLIENKKLEFEQGRRVTNVTTGRDRMTRKKTPRRR